MKSDFKMAKNQSNAAEDLQTEILLKEADEALRQEKLEALWKEWGQTIIGMALMIIFGTMLGVGWKTWRHGVYEARTQALVVAEDHSMEWIVSPDHGDLGGVHEGVAHLLAAGRIIEGANENALPMEMRSIIADSTATATKAGLPREWDLMAEWANLRMQADTVTDEGERKIAIADEMMHIATRRKNPYAPMMMVEAAAIYGENGQTQKALDVLAQAKGHELAIQTPAVMEEIQKLMHLYALDKVGE